MHNKLTDMLTPALDKVDIRNVVYKNKKMFFAKIILYHPLQTL
mgnify:CR=1 FL=1